MFDIIIKMIHNNKSKFQPYPVLSKTSITILKSKIETFTEKKYNPRYSFFFLNKFLNPYLQFVLSVCLSLSKISMYSTMQ